MSKGEDNKPIEEDNLERVEMPKKSRKRIYNPWTKTFYSIRQRSSVRGKKGTIKGKWKPPKKKKRRK